MVNNHRVHPFTLMKFPHLITNEEHTITTQPETNLIGFYTSESIHLNEGVSTVVIREGNSEFIEVTNDPQQNQYRVDYEAENYQGTGFILFNALDLNRVVTVEYEGLGSVVHKDNVNNLQSNVETVQNNLNTVKSDVNTKIDAINHYLGQHLFINHGTINPANFPLDFNVVFNRLLLNVLTLEQMRAVEAMITNSRNLTFYVQAPGGGGAGSQYNSSDNIQTVGSGGQAGDLNIANRVYNQQAITIITGTGGFGGTAGNASSTSLGRGGNGGNATVSGVGNTITAFGGYGGVNGISTRQGTNGLSGSNGESSAFGRGGFGRVVNDTNQSNSGEGYGTGGAGAHNVAIQSRIRTGGAGRQGCVLIVFRGAQ